MLLNKQSEKEAKRGEGKENTVRNEREIESAREGHSGGQKGSQNMVVGYGNVWRSVAKFRSIHGQSTSHPMYTF